MALCGGWNRLSISRTKMFFLIFAVIVIGFVSTALGALGCLITLYASNDLALAKSVWISVSIFAVIALLFFMMFSL